MQSNVTPAAVQAEAIAYPMLVESDAADGSHLIVLAQCADQTNSQNFFATVVAVGTGETTYSVGTYASFALVHFKPFHGSVSLAN